MSSLPAEVNPERAAFFMDQATELDFELLRMVKAADPELLRFYYGTQPDRVLSAHDAIAVLQKHPEAYLLTIPTAQELWLPADEGGLYRIPKSEDGTFRHIPLGMRVDALSDASEALRFDPMMGGVYALATKDHAIEQRVIAAALHGVRCQWDSVGAMRALWIGEQERDPVQGLNVDYVQYTASAAGDDEELARQLIHLDTQLAESLGGLQKSQVVIVEHVGAMEVGIRDLLTKIGERPGVNVIVTMAPEDVVAMCAREELMTTQFAPIFGPIESEELRRCVAREYGELQEDFMTQMATMTPQQLLVKIPSTKADTTSEFSTFWALRS